ncbi:MAG TPA: hypothetical protein PLZ73_11295, partial [bacterium]|nr:hypothetical protein [bacterium]
SAAPPYWTPDPGRLADMILMVSALAEPAATADNTPVVRTAARKELVFIIPPSVPPEISVNSENKRPSYLMYYEERKVRKESGKIISDDGGYFVTGRSPSRP